MRRRTFLAGLGLAALQLAGCAAQPQTVPDFVLTYADNQPAGYPTTQGAQYFADLVQQQTGGRVAVQVKVNGEYGSERTSIGMPTICGACWMAASGRRFCRTLLHRVWWA